MLDISRQLYTEVIDDISGIPNHIMTENNHQFKRTPFLLCAFIIALTKQLTDKYDLPVKSAFGASRGFYLQLYCGGSAAVSAAVAGASEIETPAPVVSQASRTMSAEDLPREFLKVTKNRSTFSFTTLDLIKLNSM
jgi:hypothetical protein